VSARARVLEFDVTVDGDRVARSGLGGTPLPGEAEWWAEHLVLAGLVRCALASMDYAARRAGMAATGSGRAHGTVTKREDDGVYAFVDVSATLDVDLAPAPDAPTLEKVVAKAEHGCFVGNSLTVQPRYSWIVNGKELAS
jgi:organic hydroperoxide reductase OsmC/OhrA